jgi:hypothetical protein
MYRHVNFAFSVFDIDWMVGFKFAYYLLRQCVHWQCLSQRVLAQRILGQRWSAETLGLIEEISRNNKGRSTSHGLVGMTIDTDKHSRKRTRVPTMSSQGPY